MCSHIIYLQKDSNAIPESNVFYSLFRVKYHRLKYLKK